MDDGTWDPLSFDAEAARMIGVYLRLRELRGNPAAHASRTCSLPLYTRNPSDFSALKRILKVVKV